VEKKERKRGGGGDHLRFPGNLQTGWEGSYFFRGHYWRKERGEINVSIK